MHHELVNFTENNHIWYDIVIVQESRLTHNSQSIPRVVHNRVVSIAVTAHDLSTHKYYGQTIFGTISVYNSGTKQLLHVILHLLWSHIYIYISPCNDPFRNFRRGWSGGVPILITGCSCWHSDWILLRMSRSLSVRPATGIALVYLSTHTVTCRYPRANNASPTPGVCSRLQKLRNRKVKQYYGYNTGICYTYTRTNYNIIWYMYTVLKSLYLASEKTRLYGGAAEELMILRRKLSYKRK